MSGADTSSKKKELIKHFSSFLHVKHISFHNSATSSFFILLEALKINSHKREVILPAYTASCLLFAIEKAGLKPVLCDISLKDFNLDANLLSGLVSENTLCILGVHMFGIVAHELSGLREKFPGVYIIEDCAQSLGSKYKGYPVGNLSDAGFFSFNRGKNVPTYGGGCIATNSEEISEKIHKEEKRVNAVSFGENVLIPFKMLTLSLAVNPVIYGFGYPLISRFKEITPQKDFKVKEYSGFQAAVALSLMKRIEEFSNKRFDNGVTLIQGLKGLNDIILPEISEDTQPAFNRFPLIFKDLKRREAVEADLWKAGIETSRMYLKPLHHLFDLGYEKNEFPNATYFASHILTLPVHPLLNDRNLTNILNTITKTT
jgi:dTDP-4-amino-4,6-dideoxygalactose transaminase